MPKSLIDWLASREPQNHQEVFDELSWQATVAWPVLFECWAHPHQLPPEGDWRTWVISGGRGAGKTRAGAEWVRAMVEGNLPHEPGQARRIALIGETLDQARDVMVLGSSGILACTPPDRFPRWDGGRRQLIWPNGATAQIISAREPESLRGPQFDAAWCDELAKWRRGDEAWDMLQFALRLGEHPRQIVTTTPRNVAVYKRILSMSSTVQTQAPTEANRAYLAESFLAEIRERYAGTRLGRQELDGILLEDISGALWSPSVLEAALIDTVPPLTRVVVAVDPPVTGTARSDACGIVVAGVVASGDPHEWRAIVLEDASVEASGPTAWAAAAIAAFRRHGADRLVAEVNQGGDLVESVIRQVDPMIPYRAVRASKGKAARAEPIAALYERGRVSHVRGLTALEEELCHMTVHGYAGRGSPDRVDALVWALADLMIDPAQHWRSPQIRGL